MVNEKGFERNVYHVFDDTIPTFVCMKSEPLREISFGESVISAEK